jgi:hypothetical protein
VIANFLVISLLDESLIFERAVAFDRLVLACVG